MSNRLIIIGASTRAAAQSSIIAGFEPYCIDMFADRDLRATCEALRVPAGQYPHGLAAMVRDAPDGPLVFTGAMENHIDVLDRIMAAGRRLPGCSPATVRCVRQPELWTRLPVITGVRPCRTGHEGVRTTRCLIKPLRSAGGGRVRFLNSGDTVTTHEYAQEYVEGVPISVCYVGRERSAALCGVTEQIIGDPAFGASGFRYVGNIWPAQVSADQVSAMSRLGDALADRYDLRGPFGVDAVVNKGGDVRPVELNPRYTAGMELIERGRHASVFVPDIELNPKASNVYHGKSIVFAQHDMIVGDLYEVFDPSQVADVPALGEPIEAGQPICTVFATGRNRDDVLACLRDRAATLYTRIAHGPLQRSAT